MLKIEQYLEEFKLKVETQYHDVLNAFVSHTKARAAKDETDAVALLKSLGYDVVKKVETLVQPA